MASSRGTFWPFFARGLAILLPSILTLWVLWTASVFLFTNVAEPINAWLRGAVVRAVPHVVSADNLPAWYDVTAAEIAEYRTAKRGDLVVSKAGDDQIRSMIRREGLQAYWRARWFYEAAGLAVAIVLIYLAGWLLGGLIGRRVFLWFERVLAVLPGFKQIYPHMKQLVSLVMGEKASAFQRVVMVQFPHQGAWVLGFVTGAPADAMRVPLKNVAALTVFIPSTPTPFTGYTLTVPASDVIEVPISIDEALRYLITGGVLVPSEARPGVALPSVASLRPAPPDPPGSQESSLRGPRNPASAPASRNATELPSPHP